MRIVEKEVLLMAVSEAQKKSAQKWDAANLDRVSIAMPKGMKDTVKAAAAVACGDDAPPCTHSAPISRVITCMALFLPFTR